MDESVLKSVLEDVETIRTLEALEGSAAPSIIRDLRESSSAPTPGIQLLEKITQDAKDSFAAKLQDTTLTEQERAEGVAGFAAKLDSFIDDIRTYVRGRPLLLAQKVIRKLASLDIEVTQEQLAEIRARIEASSAREKGEYKHVFALTTTSDPLGTMLRGHVLLENEVEGCINAYLARPLDLYKKLEVFFDQKLRLARSLGIISDAEYALLKRVNVIRNNLAHPQDKQYTFSQGEEKSLWDQFTAVPTLAGNWPEYRPGEDLRWLKLILVGTYSMLSNRKELLEKRRLPSLDDELRTDPLVRELYNAYTQVLVRLIPKAESAFVGAANEAKDAGERMSAQ